MGGIAGRSRGWQVQEGVCGEVEQADDGDWADIVHIEQRFEVREPRIEADIYEDDDLYWAGPALCPLQDAADWEAGVWSEQEGSKTVQGVVRWRAVRVEEDDSQGPEPVRGGGERADAGNFLPLRRSNVGQFGGYSTSVRADRAEVEV